METQKFCRKLPRTIDDVRPIGFLGGDMLFRICCPVDGRTRRFGGRHCSRGKNGIPRPKRPTLTLLG